MYYTELSPTKRAALAKSAESACRMTLKKLGVKLKNALEGTPRFSEWETILAYLDPEIELHTEHGFAPDSPPHPLILYAYNTLDNFGVSQSASEVIAGIPEALTYELQRLGLTKKLVDKIDYSSAKDVLCAPNDGKQEGKKIPGNSKNRR
jgi:hypothetical protein